MKHNERARVAPLPFVHRKYMNGRLRRVAACGGLRPAAACGNRSPRRRSLPLATLPPATLLFATLPACGGLRPPDAPRRRPAAPPCGGGPPTALVFFSCARLRRGRSGLTMSCRFELPLCDACAARVRAFAQRGGRSRRRRPWRLPPPRAFVTLPPALLPALPPTFPPAFRQRCAHHLLVAHTSPAVHAHEMPFPAHKRRRMTALR